MTTPAIAARGITKSFPGVLALRSVDLVVAPGEVVAVVGENGAGKSTLMKVLAGVQAPDAGTLEVRGEAVRFASVGAAQSRGIALVHQELCLCDNLTVGANVLLGREPRRGWLLDERELAVRARAALARVGLDVAPELPLASLSIAQRQLVEIAKALAVDAKVLILDEPTSSLSQAEAERLFSVVRELGARGTAVVYISHRLAEVTALAQRVVVLRDGANAGELVAGDITHDALVRLMVGRDVSRFFGRSAHAPGEVALCVRGVRTAAWPRHAIDFEVRAGEVVGLAGLVGAGRSELLRALFGIDDRVEGEVSAGGRAIARRDPGASLSAGLALVPEDRKSSGAVLDLSVRENLALASLWRDRRALGFFDGTKERALATTQSERLRIRTPSLEQLVRWLSGGNQQKVVLGSRLALEPRVLLLDEPTRGIDVGAKAEIYAILHELAGAGLAILLASSELEEIVGTCDRVLVVHEGRIAGELTGKAINEESIMRLATGKEDCAA